MKQPIQEFDAGYFGPREKQIPSRSDGAVTCVGDEKNRRILQALDLERFKHSLLTIKQTFQSSEQCPMSLDCPGGNILWELGNDIMETRVVGRPMSWDVPIIVPVINTLPLLDPKTFETADLILSIDVDEATTCQRRWQRNKRKGPNSRPSQTFAEAHSKVDWKEWKA